MLDKDGGKGRGLRQEERRISEPEGIREFRMCLFMFGMHPGVLFNGSRIGHGVSLVQNHKMEEERVSE